MMIPRRVGVDGCPVVVAVVAAVGHQCIVGLQPPVQIVLHQRLALGDGSPHFGAVHHLRPALRIALQYLVVVEMVMIPLVRHGGLQQGVTINIHLLGHNSKPPIFCFS